MLWIALVKILDASLGATFSTLSIRGWVAESPISPSTEISTISAGKTASTP
jgi:hypothetical protein